jgi:hypothetical protein
MHPAHPLGEGDVTMGAGFSGTLPVEPPLTGGVVPERLWQESAFAPGLAPWVSGRLGIDGSFDAGLTYTGRAARVDARHAWVFEESTALSLGLGGSGLLPKRDDDLALRVGGFGFDVPLLLGYMSDADIYAVWLGARGGAEYLTGQRELLADPLDPSAPLSEKIQGWHAHAGGLVGMRVGFRYVFAVLELDAAMHWARGTIGANDVTAQMFTLAPAGALIVRF